VHTSSVKVEVSAHTVIYWGEWMGDWVTDNAVSWHAVAQKLQDAGGLNLAY